MTTDESLRYSYVQLTNSQYLDTGYLYQPSTTVETILYVPQTKTSSKNYQVIFGAHDGEEANSMSFMPWNSWKSDTSVDAAYYIAKGSQNQPYDNSSADGDR